MGPTVLVEGVFDVWIHTYKDALLFKLFYELDDVVFLDVVSVGADVVVVVIVVVIVATVVVVVIVAKVVVVVIVATVVVVVIVAVLIVATTEVAERPF